MPKPGDAETVFYDTKNYNITCYSLIIMKSKKLLREKKLSKIAILSDVCAKYSEYSENH